MFAQVLRSKGVAVPAVCLASTAGKAWVRRAFAFSFQPQPGAADASSSSSSSGFSFGSFGGGGDGGGDGGGGGAASGGGGGEDDGGEGGEAYTGPTEGEEPSEDVPPPVAADSSKLLLPSESIVHEVRAAVKRWDTGDKSWANLDTGTLRIIKDSSTGKSRIVFSPPNSTRGLINTFLNANARLDDVPGGVAGGKARLECILLVPERGLTKFIFTVKTASQAQELKAAFLANKSK